MKSPKRAAVYCRISQDRRAESAGVKRQEADCRALAAERGWTVTKVYVDNDVSAYSRKPRPAFEVMLAEVKAGSADLILTWSTDRLYRRPADLERIVDELKGVDVATVKSGDVDLSTADGRAMARVVGSFAIRESEKMGERVAAASLDRAKRGAYSGGPRAFGYEPDGVTIRTDEARVLRTAYRDVLAGRSLLDVARRMNAKGSTGTNGAEWSGVTVRDALLRPRYAGLRTHRGEIIGDAAWKPIIDRETWERVRAILDDPARRTTKGRPAESLLGGLLKCTKCGTSLMAKSRFSASTNREPVAIYACKPCGRSRTRDLMDEYVTEVVLAYLEREAIEGRAVELPADDAPDVAEADDLRRRISSFSDLAATMNPTDYAAAVGALRARLAEVEARLTTASGRPATASLGLDVRKGWKRVDDESRRTVLREALERIDVGPGAMGRHGIEAVAHNTDFVWRTA